MYVPLKLDPAAPPPLRRAIQTSLEFGLQDVRTMLQLPKRKNGLHASCNYSALIVLCAVIAAASRMLYPRAGTDAEAFKDVLQAKYPWNEEPTGGMATTDAAEMLYTEFRCPLVHAAGLPIEPQGHGSSTVYKLATGGTVRKVKKYRGLSDRQLREIETSPKRPKMSQTFTYRRSENTKVVLVEGLYWGVRRMIVDLVADPAIRSAAMYLLTGKLVVPPSVVPHRGAGYGMHSVTEIYNGAPRLGDSFTSASEPEIDYFESTRPINRKDDP
jgi:hypothetical protein